MPFLHIRIQGRHAGPDEAASLQASMTDLICEILGKKRPVTAVLYEEVSGRWMIGGQPVAVAAQLDVLITEGTNTDEEKARFIAAAHALLRQAVGSDLPEATYVTLHEPKAESWGYDGRTQAARRLAAQPL